MRFSPVNSHRTQNDALPDVCMYVHELTATPASPASVKKAKELDLDETDVVGLFRKKN